jgi:uncharacterized protein (TIGR02594 family)
MCIYSLNIEQKGSPHMKKLIAMMFAMYCLVACTANAVVSIPQQDNTKVSVLPGNVLLEAYRFYGVHETRPELNDYLEGVNPRHTEWCAAFVNQVLYESGVPGSESVSNVPLMARSFLTWGDAVVEPKPGDIVVFPRGNQGWQGHVGFYLKTDNINGVDYYIILGGNQNNRVSIKPYLASRALGIRRPSISNN